MDKPIVESIMFYQLISSFSEKISLDISCELSGKQTSQFNEMSKLIFFEN